MKAEEMELWEQVDQELMSDEEDLEEGKLKKKTLANLRCDELNDLTEALDSRYKQANASEDVLRKKRVASDSPLKRKLSKKVKTTLLKKD